MRKEVGLDFIELVSIGGAIFLQESLTASIFAPINTAMTFFGGRRVVSFCSLELWALVALAAAWQVIFEGT
jgi:hypothetical protein